MEISQDIRNKRGEIEWHKIAVFGEPEKALATYVQRNDERRQIFDHYKDHIRKFSPFLEIGANAAYTSSMLVNEWNYNGIAVDISADALKAATIIGNKMGYSNTPLKLCLDAGRIPLKNNSIQFVFVFQSLHHFIDPEPVIKEIKRVLVDGGTFLFAEEPVKRRLTLNLYRTRREESFNWLERRLKNAGILRYISEAYFGSKEETDFGIMENQGISLKKWIRILKDNFDEVTLDYSGVYVMGKEVRFLVNFLSKIFSVSRAEQIAADLMGCSLKGFCRAKKKGESSLYNQNKFFSSLICPDCKGDFSFNQKDLICLSCGYISSEDSGVFNLLPTREKEALYRSSLQKQIVFSEEGHGAYLGEGWYELEGSSTTKYRKMQKEATVYLRKDAGKDETIRLCGYIGPESIETHKKIKFEVFINQVKIGEKIIKKSGIFIFEKKINLEGDFSSPVQIKLAVDRVYAAEHGEYGAIISYIKLTPVDSQP